MTSRQGLPREYIEIQLRFAETLAHNRGSHVAYAVLRYTNLFRRFGLGRPNDALTNPQWHRYTSTLATLRTLPERLDWTEEFAAGLEPTSPIRPSEARLGPFSVGIDGPRLRIHFVPPDNEGLSPLHPSKRDRRREELRNLFALARASHPNLRRVGGASWLYTTASYRALFPPQHIATAIARTGFARFQGSSSWGQFLDHRGDVKANLREQFLDGLSRLDMAAPWLAFPIPTLVVDSPVEVFEEYFSLQG